jgi:hypothetical protein
METPICSSVHGGRETVDEARAGSRASKTDPLRPPGSKMRDSRERSEFSESMSPTTKSAIKPPTTTRVSRVRVIPRIRA